MADISSVNVRTLFLQESMPLTGVVTSYQFAPLPAESQFRRYGGSLTSVAQVLDAPDSDAKRIGYHIGIRRRSAMTLNYLHAEITPMIDQRVVFNDSLHRGMSERITKHLNYSPDFQKGDLSGLIFRLAAGLAHYSHHGDVSCVVLRGGMPVRAQAMSATLNALPSRDTVFVPRDTSLVDSPAAFSAIVAAANGEGSLVISDMLEIDGTTNAAVVYDYSGFSCLEGIMTALRILLGMYEVSGAGMVAGVALAKGLHSVSSVVAMSDEGGGVRDMWRCQRFSKPYGFVYSASHREEGKWPVLPVGDRCAAQCFVDGLCLKTAALSALADPLVEINGRKYPTIITTGDVSEAGVGRAEIGEGDVANKRIRMAWLAASGRWTQRYAELLGELVSDDTDLNDEAIRAMNSMLGAMCRDPQYNRHFSGATIAPTYWVEPTSLFQHRDKTEATQEGYGNLCGTDEDTVQDAFPNSSIIRKSDGTWVGVAVDFRSLRTFPAALHHYYHNADGLGYMTPYQLRPDMVTLPGGGHNPQNPLEDGGVRDAMHAGQSLDCYAWRHGGCLLPSPAEMLYLGNKVGFRIDHSTTVNSWDICPNRVIDPEGTGPAAAQVRYIARRPGRLATHGLGDYPQDVRRDRSRATCALQIATLRRQSAYNATDTAGHMMFSEPGEYSLPQHVEDTPPDAYTTLSGIDSGLRAPTRQRGQARRLVVTDQVSRFRPTRRQEAPLGATRVVAAPPIGEGAPPGPPAAAPSSLEEVPAIVRTVPADPRESGAFETDGGPTGNIHPAGENQDMLPRSLERDNQDGEAGQ